MAPARQSLRRVLAIAVLALAMSSSCPARAHAVLVKSEPAQRAKLLHSPSSVRLWFNEKLEPSFSSLVVLDSAGRPVTQASATVPAADPRLIELALPALGAGRYTVQYRVLSIDGHRVKAAFAFDVQPAGAPR